MPLDVVKDGDEYRFDGWAWVAWLKAWCEATAPPGAYFDPAAARLACAFFPRFLTFSKGDHGGRPFNLLHWQQAVIAALYGWKLSDGTRRFRELFLLIPRKNGKTELSAGIGLLSLCQDDEFGGEVYSCGTQIEQARLTFEVARGMRFRSNALMSRTTSSSKSIVFGATNSSWKPLTGRGDTKDGLNASCALYDEVHEWRSPQLYDKINTSMGARSQPLEAALTTAGQEGPSLCNDWIDRARDVLVGTIDDPHMLPVLFSAANENFKPHDYDLNDPRLWAMCNPSLGQTVNARFLARDALRATTDALRARFLRMFLCVTAASDNPFLPMAAWRGCNLAPVTLDQLRGRKVWLGIDLSSRIDLCSLGLVSPWPGGGGFDIWSRSWMPRERVAQATQNDKVPYALWAEKGLIELCDGPVNDFDCIRRLVTGRGDLPAAGEPLASICDVQLIAHDRWQSSQLMADLGKDGLTCVGFGQGYRSMTDPVKTLETLVLTQRVNHGGDPLLEWCIGNAVRRDDEAENCKIVKPNRRATVKRIDPVIAVLMALGAAIRQAPPVADGVIDLGDDMQPDLPMQMIL